MTNYQGFSVSHVNEKVDSNGVVSSNCMSIDFQNVGVKPVELSIKESDVKYKLETGDSITFPKGANSNPLLELVDWFSLGFVGEGEEESLVIVTKTYASPKILMFN